MHPLERLRDGTVSELVAICIEALSTVGFPMVRPERVMVTAVPAGILAVSAEPVVITMEFAVGADANPLKPPFIAAVGALKGAKKPSG